VLKLLRRLICLGVLLAGAFLYLSLTEGGRSIRRWADRLHKETLGLANTAQQLHESAQEVKEKSRETLRGIKRIANTIRGSDD
jgi:type VI protein secretion system component VasK